MDGPNTLKPNIIGTRVVSTESLNAISLEKLKTSISGYLMNFLSLRGQS